MANLGTLWFEADIKLDELKKKISEGNADIQNILKNLNVTVDTKSLDNAGHSLNNIATAAENAAKSSKQAAKSQEEDVISLANRYATLNQRIENLQANLSKLLSNGGHSNYFDSQIRSAIEAYQQLKELVKTSASTNMSTENLRQLQSLMTLLGQTYANVNKDAKQFNKESERNSNALTESLRRAEIAYNNTERSIRRVDELIAKGTTAKIDTTELETAKHFLEVLKRDLQEIKDNKGVISSGTLTQDLLRQDNVVNSFKQMRDAISSANKEIKLAESNMKQAEREADKLHVTISNLQALERNANALGVDTTQLRTVIDHLKQYKTELENIKSTNAQSTKGFISQESFLQTKRDIKEVTASIKKEMSDALKPDTLLTTAFKEYASILRQITSLTKTESKASALGIDTSTLRNQIALLERYAQSLEMIARNGGLGLSAFKSTDYLNARNAPIGEQARLLSEIAKKKKDNALASAQLSHAEEQMAAAIKGSTSAMHSQSQLLNDLKSLAMQYLGVWGAQNFMHNIIEIGGQLERQRLSMGAILGDVQKANVLFGQIKDLAIKSPFGVVELDQYSKQLAAYGFQYHELYDMTKRLADISAGAGTDISRIALALGHVRSEGALSGYTLRQFAMNNIPMLKKLSEYLSEIEGKLVTTAEIRKRVSKKQIGYDDVIAVIKQLTDEGGMFYNMQEVISESVSAKFKNLKDSMDIMYGEMAESKLGDSLKEVAAILTQLTRHWKVLFYTIGSGMLIFGAWKAMVIASNYGLRQNIEHITMSGMAMKNLTAEQVKNMATSGALSRSDLMLAVATKKLRVEQAELAAAHYGVSTAQLQQMRSTTALAGASRGLLGMFGKMFSPQMLLFAAAEIGVGMWSYYSEWVDKIDNKTKEMVDLQKSRIKDLEDAQKTYSENRPTNELGYRNAIEDMQKVLANSNAYTKTIDDQLTKTGKLSEKYDTLAGAIQNAADKQKAMLDWEETLGEAIKESSWGFLGDNERFNNLQNIPWLNNDISKNIGDVNDSYASLRKIIDGAWEYKDALKSVIDQMIKSEDVSESFRAQLEGAPFEEQIRLLAESDYWGEVISKVNETNSGFEDAAARIRKASHEVTDDWDEIASDDIPKIFQSIAEQRGIEEKEFREWCVDNPEEFNTMMEALLDRLDVDAPKIRQKIKGMFYDFARIGELEKGLAEGALIGGSIFSSTNINKLFPVEEKADVNPEKNPSGANDKAIKAAEKAAKKDAQAKAKAIELEQKFQEQMDKLRRDMEDAQAQASIAAIQNDAERERAERKFQHEKTLRDIRLQEEEIYKKIYEERKKIYEAAHKNDKGGGEYELDPLGALGWQGVKDSKKTEKEAKQIALAISKMYADISTEESKFARDNRNEAKNLTQYLYDYLKEYGSIQDKKYAITKEYDQKIEDAETEMQKALLRKQKENALKELDFKEWQQSIDWEGIFNELKYQTSAALEEIKNQLRTKLTSGDITAENAKILAEKIKEIDTLLSQRKDPFASWLPGLRERLRLTNEVKEAEEKIAGLQKTSDQKREDLIKLITSTANISEGALLQGFSSNIAADDFESIVKSLGIESEAVTVALTDFKKALENTSQAQKDYEKRQKALANFTKGGSVSQYFSDITAGLDFEGYVKLVNSNVQSLNELVDNVGLSSTEFGQGVSDFAEGVSGFSSAIQSLASGDVIGAVNGVIDGFQGFGHLFERIGGFSFNGSNAAEINKQLSRLSSRNEILTDSIDRLNETMGGQGGSQAIETYAKMAELQKEMEENLQKQIKLQMQYHDAHKSFNYYWDGFTKQQLSDFNRRNNTNWNGDLASLTPELAAALMADANMWQAIKETGKGGYGERVAQQIEELAKQAGVAEEQVNALNAALTAGTTKDSVFDDFLNSLYDLADGAEDVMKDIDDNWQKMVNHMVVNNLIGENFRKKLEDWYTKLANLNKARQGYDENGNPITPISTEEYKRQLDELKKEYNGFISEAQSDINTFTELGVIKPIEEAEDKIKDYGETVSDAFKELLSGSVEDVEAWGKEVQKTIAKTVMESLLFDNAFNEWAKNWGDRYSKLWEQYMSGSISKAEYEARLNVMQQEWNDKMDEMTEKGKAFAETFNDSLELDTTFTDMKDSFVSALMDMDTSLEDFANDMKKTIVQKMVEAFMVSDKIKPLLDDLQNTFNYAMGLEGADEKERARIIAQGYTDAEGEVHKGVDNVAEELTPLKELVNDILEAIGYKTKEIETLFSSLGDTIKSALMDTENGLDSFMDSITKSITEDLVKSYMATEEFQQGLKGVKDDLEAAVKAVAEAKTDEEISAANKQLDAAKDKAKAFYEAAEAGTKAYTDALKKAEEPEVDKTFTDMADSFKSALMDMDSDADDWGREIGKTLSDRIIEQMLVPKLITPLLQNIQDAFDDAVEAATSMDADGNAVYDWSKVLGDEALSAAIRNMQEQYPQLKELFQNIMTLAGANDTSFSNSLDSLTDTIVDRLLTLDDDVEDIGKQIGSTLVKEMIAEMLASEKYASKIEGIRKMWQAILSGEDTVHTIDDVLNEIAAVEKDITKDEDIKKLSDKWKEWNRQIEDTKVAIEDLTSQFADSLGDMDSSADDFGKNLKKTLLSNALEQYINGTYGEQLKTKNEQLATAVANHDIAEIDRIIAEIAQLYNYVSTEDLNVTSLQSAMSELGDNLEDTFDTTFSSMTDSWVDALTGMEDTAEDWAENVGKTMAKMIVKSVIAPTILQPILDDLQNVFNGLVEGGASYQTIISDTLPYIDEMKGIWEAWEPVIESINNAFGIFRETAEEAEEAVDEIDYALKDMKSNFVSSLMDMTNSAEDFADNISKIMAETFIEKFVLGDAFDAQMKVWQERYEAILSSGMSEEERKRQLKNLRDDIVAYEEAQKKSAAAVMELFGLGTSSNQEATMNMADKITYDQADQLLGINLAQELTLEQILATLQGNSLDYVPKYSSLVGGNALSDDMSSQIQSTLQTLAMIQQTGNENLLTQVAMANSHLQMIRDYGKQIRDEVVMHLGSMDSKLSSLRTL